MTIRRLPDLKFTLCFLLRGDSVLMLHRNNPPNEGKWNGVGGHIEPGESPMQACLREVWEETGYDIPKAWFGGLLTWEGFEIGPGGLYLFTAPAPFGEPNPNGEGRLAWVTREWACSAPEVVDNLHIVLPFLFRQETPRVFHFQYQDGRMKDWDQNPLSDHFLRTI
ncbi:MAG TPA: NUDIX domain-containing protein [Anaerolineaceae bacterium]|jgi:8-oxo-dGTP diphosphatase|nr:NUDIX domain-containing protein [Anaerolineaceae bacterium]NMD31383.1 NUDIX domain-containing protein [Chloroflexota bacterium]HOD43901.1 NUDIX domain-containing protein [Anaerolineaceae bacterium]HOU42708.1 NUDIX domain-containing protein [Anaerolineaceae bacterium]HPA32154.1 NUDIX domain-containing protein [Anaerolineaceae bacterium]